MNLLGPVSSIMSKDLITIFPDDSIEHIEEIFHAHRIHHLPVINEGKLVGMVSKSDVLFLKRGFDQEVMDEKTRLNFYRAKDIMTTQLATLEPGDKVNVALEIFKENLFHAIPIVDNGFLKGIVTPYDFISALSKKEVIESEYLI